MKHFLKIFFFMMSLCLMVGPLVACGSSGDDTGDGTESNTEIESNTETEAERCMHENRTTASQPSTCAEAGWEEFTCNDCGATVRVDKETLPHELVTTHTKGASLDLATCSVCGKISKTLAPSESMAFDAYCEGNMVIEFRVKGETKVEFRLDGMALSNKTYTDGIYSTTVIKDFPADEYSFGVTNTGNGSVEITDIIFEGNINTKDGVILELNKKNDNKGTYEDFFVYVKTSDPSGKYYVRYNFIYEYNEEVVDKANSTANIDAFRVKEAYLVEITEKSATDLKYNQITQVLQQGEISLAIKESGVTDFVGGYHGDDHMTEFTLCADGKEYVPGKEDRVVECSYITIHQKAIINRCAKPDDPVMIHDQNYLIDSTGVKNNKSVEWLVDNFKVVNGYLQMFTLYRVSGGKTVCETVSTYDANGKLLGSETVTGAVDKGYTVLSSSKIKEVHYTSATSGVSAVVGYDIVDDSVVLKNGSISIRQYNDNKWYPNFRSPVNGDTPAVGEVWKIISYFDIDYVAPIN